MKKLILLGILSLNLLNAENFFYSDGKKVQMQPKISTKSLDSNASSEDVFEYTTTDGKNIKFKNQIIVKCNDNAYCEDDFSDLNLTSYKKIFNNMYLIKLENGEDIFEYCQKLYEKDDIKEAHPNLVRKVLLK